MKQSTGKKKENEIPPPFFSSVMVRDFLAVDSLSLSFLALGPTAVPEVLPLRFLNQ